MKRLFLFLASALLTVSLSLSATAGDVKQVKYNDLPQGAKDVIQKIQSGSTDWPFVKKDGSRFGNREKRLPADKGSSYREYTVCSEKMNRDLRRGKRPNRGAQRIIYDQNNRIFYYTADHYRTFSRVVFENGKP